MSYISVIFGIIVGLILLIPQFFIRDRRAKTALIIIAVIAAVLSTQLYERKIYPYYLGKQFEQELNKQPIFNLIAKTHPKEYQDFLNTVKPQIHSPSDFNRVSVYSAQLMNRVFYQHLAQAPDDPIFLYLRSTLDLYRYLYEKNPAYVVKIEKGLPIDPLEMNKLWDDKSFQLLYNHVLESKILIIETSIKTPVTKVESSDALLEGILAEMTTKFGQELMNLVFSNSLNSAPPAIGAGFIIGFYSEIIASGKESAGNIMRHIAQTNLKEQNKDHNP